MTARRPNRIRVLTLPGDPTRGTLSIGASIYPCALGRSGVSHRKREGDGATPAGKLPLLAVRYRADRMARPVTLLPVRPIRVDDGWCDAEPDPNYNRPVRRPYAASHEAMWRDDALYDIVVILDWNLTKRAKRRGSAIFLHLARPGFRPTEGCVAVRRHDMLSILRRIGRRTAMLVE